MSKSEVDSQIDYAKYLLKLKHLRDRDLPFSAIDEDSCTAEGGSWVTIKGTHVCIKQGESPEQAFERTTGKKLEPEGEPKDLKTPDDQVVSGEPKVLSNEEYTATKEKITQAIEQNKPVRIEGKSSDGLEEIIIIENGQMTWLVAGHLEGQIQLEGIDKRAWTRAMNMLRENPIKVEIGK